MRDNQAVEQRADVLVFSSEPLAEPVEILGEVAALGRPLVPTGYQIDLASSALVMPVTK